MIQTIKKLKWIILFVVFVLGLSAALLANAASVSVPSAPALGSALAGTAGGNYSTVSPGSQGTFLGNLTNGVLGFITPGFTTVCRNGCNYTATGTADHVGAQAAIDAMSTIGVGTVLLKNATYTFSSTLNLKSGVNLLCSPGTVITVATSSNQSIYFNGINNASITGCTFTDPTVSYLGLGISAYRLVEIHDSRNIKFKDNTVNSVTGYGLYITTGANASTTGVEVAGNYINAFGHQDAIGGGPFFQSNGTTSEISIHDNWITQTVLNGTVGVNTDANCFDMVAVKGLIFKDNHCWGQIWFGHEKVPNVDSIISGNILYPAYGATSTSADIEIRQSVDSIATQTPARLIVSGNILNGGGIRVEGGATSSIENIIVANNDIKNAPVNSQGSNGVPAGYGIYFDYVKNSKINDNIIQASTSTAVSTVGILLSNTTSNITTSDNTIKDYVTCENHNNVGTNKSQWPTYINCQNNYINIGSGVSLGQSILQFSTSGSNAAILQINAAGGSQQAGFKLQDAGTNKYEIGKQTDNSFFIYDDAHSRDAMDIDTSGNILFGKTGGNVAIGTTNTTYPLTVVAASNPQLDVIGTGANAGGIYIDNLAGGNQSYIKFLDAAAAKFELGKQTDNTFFLYDDAHSRNVLQTNTAGDLNLLPSGGLLTVSGTSTLATTTVAKLTITNITGTQCLHSVSGVVSGTGSDCGSGGGSGLGTTTPFTSGYVPYATSTLTLTDSPIAIANGKVGIGVVTPAYLLHLQATSSTANVQMLKLQNSATGLGTAASIDFNMSTSDLTTNPTAQIRGTRTGSPGGELDFYTLNAAGVTTLGMYLTSAQVLAASSTLFTNSTTTGQFFLPGVTAGSILTTNGQNMVVATTTIFQPVGTAVLSVTGSGSVVTSGTQAITVQLQTLAANDILFGQGSGVIATSSNLTFTNTNTLAVTGTSTISNALLIGTGTKLISPFINGQTLIAASGTVANYLEFNLQNQSNSTTASSDYVLTANNGTATNNYSEFFQNSSGYTRTSAISGGALDAGLFSSDAALILGTASSTNTNANINLVSHGTNIATGTATGFIFANATTTGQMGWGTITYTPPPTQGASSTFLTTNGAGQLSWGTPASSGSPCTLTGNSFQYNNAGSFGCVSTLLTNGTVIGMNATSSTIGFNIQGTGGSNDIFNAASSTGISILKITSNQRVGIGSSTPSATLVVQGTSTYPTINVLTVASSSGTSLLNITNVGNVGINSASPTQKLDVEGNIRANGNYIMTAGHTLQNDGNTDKIGIWGGTDFSTGPFVEFWPQSSSNPGQLLFEFGSRSTTTPTSYFNIAAGDGFGSGVSRFRVLQNGSVGISSTSPTALLTVQGLSGASTNLLSIASSSTVTLFGVDSKGNLSSGGTLPTTSSGTVVAGSTNTKGRTIPAAAATTATITFSQGGYGTTPFCTITQESGTAINITASATPTTLVLTGTTIGGDSIVWFCIK